MTTPRTVLRPAAWAIYVIIVLEFLFMISPFALYFYSAYAPALNVLHKSALTAWLTGFFLPHFSITTSPLLNNLKTLGFLLATAGLLVFLVTASQIYLAKFWSRKAVTGGLYALVRHPQYTALIVLGLGTLLIWPRFLVLITFITMVFIYLLLAHWEERQCLEQFGETYWIYRDRTGMILPKVRFSIQFDSFARAILVYLVTVALSIATGFGLRAYSLHHVSTLYLDRIAVLSPAVLSDRELRAAYDVASTDPLTQDRLAVVGEESLLLAYVIPQNWYLPDLPIDSHEIVRERGGHGAPADFDRRYYKVLFTQVRTHDPDARNDNIVKTAFGKDPVVLVKVDVETKKVIGLEVPPPHVVWGDIPGPMF